MNKLKKNEPKKLLVRNTHKPVPKTKLILDEDKVETNAKAKKNIFKEKPLENSTNFNVPELNSALGIAKKIDLVEKAKPLKVKDLAFDEKTTRKMNFPLDQAIYKDLIPLQVSSSKTSIISSREPFPQKDKEPILSSFVKPRQVKEYIYEPSVKIDEAPITQTLNNLRLYKMLSIHNNL